MKVFTIFSLLIIFCASKEIRISAGDENIIYTGRTQQLSENDVLFDWSGVEIAMQFEIDNEAGLYALFSDNGNAYNVFLDGQQIMILNTTNQPNYQYFISRLDQGSHDILLTKRTEAFFGIVTFSGFMFTSSEDLQITLYKHSKRQNNSSRFIEFVGDSITCGYGDEGVYPCHFSAATENNFVAYGSLTAQAFDAELHLEAWSGKGLVRNYGYPNYTSPNPLPSYWNLTIANDPTSTWNFNSWIPDAVVINLGTNDYSTEPSPPQDIFEGAYKVFVSIIQKQYSAQTPIFLVCGPMIGDPCCTYVNNVVNDLSESGVPIHFVNLTNILSFPSDFGCDGHPSVSGHRKMAEATIPIIGKVLGWDY